MTAATKIVNDLSSQIQQIQMEMMPLIQAATATGDFTKIQTLMKDMENRINALIEDQKTVEFKPDVQELKMHVYKSVHTDMDLNDIVYDYERDLFTKMESNARFLEIREHVKKHYPEKDMRKVLMRDHLKLDLKLSPKLKEVVHTCIEAMKIKTEIEVYMVNSLEVNAYCPPPTDDKIYVCITSALLEKLAIPELCYVFGHEIGHAVMAHHTIPLQHLLNNPQFQVTPEELLEIFAWKRSAEITCDRFGLICGQRFENAARGVFKIYYGLTELADDSIFSYMQNFGDFNSSITISPADFYSTHPFGPVRLLALQYFSMSENFHKSIGSTQFEISEVELEKRIDGIMKIYDVNNVTPEAQLAIDKFFMISALSISASDGNVSPDEILKMKDICKSEGLLEEVMPFVQASVPELQDQIYLATNALFEHCSLPLRMKMVRDLVYVALADGILTDTERDILYFCCSTAGVDPKFIDDTLSEIQKLT
jgi:Zn-dependent protease with chaperone function/tellurite resistance protein